MLTAIQGGRQQLPVCAAAVPAFVVSGTLPGAERSRLPTHNNTTLQSCARIIRGAAPISASVWNYRRSSGITSGAIAATAASAVAAAPSPFGLSPLQVESTRFAIPHHGAPQGVGGSDCRYRRRSHRQQSLSTAAKMRAEASAPVQQDSSQTRSDSSVATAGSPGKPAHASKELDFVPGTKFLKPSGPHKVWSCQWKGFQHALDYTSLVLQHETPSALLVGTGDVDLKITSDHRDFACAGGDCRSRARGGKWHHHPPLLPLRS